MSTYAEARPASTTLRAMLNKVPEITVFFWIIKVLATTVGETAADYLSTTLHLGLTFTSWVMGALFLAALVAQLNARRYSPPLYWTVVVLISIVGTLISDNLTDNLGVPLMVTTIAFASILTAVFTAWWLTERTLSIHSIRTRRRELFYWGAILFTFALGTSAGDWLAAASGIGFAASALVFAGMIALVVFSRYTLKLNGVLAFWLAYILTRPLGASIGDLLSQRVHDGGLGIGTTATSAVFLITILALVVYLTVTRKDRIDYALE
ncbi:MAG TPA: hypothetical protein VFN37_00795 [Candidatus Baltobacteraceae bacterium]|nr:hypothetical protein [Candidatus Baltobacteraceae bacterium]